jgi:hypothetical protein
MDMKHGMVTLAVAEAKRLIGKGVAALPQVQRAMAQGMIIIAGGTTNAYVAEELTGLTIDKARYTAGIISRGRCCVTAHKTRLSPLVLRRGELVDINWTDALGQMGPGDIFIKGGNALDPQGNLGILQGSPNGGTIGAALGSISARGIELIAPIGLEKLVPKIADSARLLGIGRMDYSRGMQCGMQIVTGATIVSEDRALALLSGCQVVVAAKGGVDSSAGSTTLAFAGPKREFELAVSVLDSVLGEKGLIADTQKCPCPNPCDFGRANPKGAI